jgi:hypothetical protein
MIMAVPLWYAYILMAPAFVLGSLTGLYTAIVGWRER